MFVRCGNPSGAVGVSNIGVNKVRACQTASLYHLLVREPVYQSATVALNI